MNPPGGTAGPQLRAVDRISGLMLLDKPVGLTSFQALGSLKSKLGTGKVGHAGTLDRFASGLLLVLIGQYTRLNEFVAAGEKVYRGTIRFGAETDTLDPEGRVIAEAPAPGLAAIEAVLPAFVGEIEQEPPAYSALHVEGKRAYKRVLAGEKLEMPARKVRIASIALESFDGRDAVLRVACGPGTYIRSLARDIGRACGSRASLAALERLAIGPFRLEEAVSPEDFDPSRHMRSLSRAEAADLGLGLLALAEGDSRAFSFGAYLGTLRFQGQPGPDLPPDSRAYAVFGPGDLLLGIVESDEGHLAYRVVLGAGS